MSLITVETVSKAYDTFSVLEDVSFSIEKRDRLGLIGKNGSGKTTLMKILVGQIFEYQGIVQFTKQLRIGHLSQDADLNPELTLHQELLQIFHKQQQIEDQMLELMLELEDESGQPDLLQKLAYLQEKHDQNGGYQYELSIKKALSGLGFQEKDWNLLTKNLSGGQRNRLALAKILLQDPDLLLLDEPTNHLDIKSTEWLENYLNKVYSGSVLMISHDRYFLDRVVTKILQLRNQRLTIYRGNYSQYRKTKALEVLTQEKEYKKQQQFIAKEQEFIRQNLAGQKSKQAQGRRTRLNRLEIIEAPDGNDETMKIKFQPQIRGGNEILQCRQLNKVFDDKTVFSGLNCDIFRGDIVGILGPNGSGKTTFLRMILGQLQPSSGTIYVGHNLTFGYYDQELTDLDEGSTLLDEIRQQQPLWTDGQIRSLLATFLFTGEDVFKLVDDLSGGERSRLLLAKLLLKQDNVLLLDEPTNHLDIHAREALEKALIDYSATVLMISHDRYLLSKLASRLLIFGENKATFYSGTYDEYQRELAEASQKKDTPVDQTIISKKQSPVGPKVQSRQSKRERVLVAKQHKRPRPR